VWGLLFLGLIPQPPGVFSGVGIFFQGQDLTALTNAEMRRIRGNQISMIFQEPMTSLNPVLTVGFQIAEAITEHQGLSRKAALERATDMLDLVGIPLPAQRAKEYPHQLSGGMRQRAMIAMALSCHPNILLADEPTTALDVTIQAQILDLMLQLKDETGAAIILITHDLGLVAETCDRAVDSRTHTTTARRDFGRWHLFWRSRSHRPLHAGDAPHSGQSDLDDFPRADDQPQSGSHRGFSDCRGDHAAPRAIAQSCPRAGG
jgi:ABC-type microcin C transport system duplicated ATPase subunit YejF